MLKQSNAALRGGKALALAARRGAPVDERLAIELEAFVATWTHDDHWNAVDKLLARQRSS